MSLKKGTPGKGEETPRVERFTYTNPQVGLAKTWNAWAAAEPYWCKAHEHTTKVPGTKPCLNWLTDGAVPCARCRPGARITDIGYCHLYREADRAPCLVIVHDSAADLLAGVTFGSFVTVGRMEGQASVFVKPCSVALKWVTELDHRKGPIDTAVSLLGIWCIPALDVWYAAQQRGARRDVLPMREPTDGKPVAGWSRFVELGSVGAMEGAVSNPGQHRNEEFVQASRNGKHPPDTPGKKPKG